ncbi:MAG: cupredoxin domain-containing protein [Solirubrobacterales bacterium]|nr:cupredoxin domain-containing protein [Solirubrobacterales bacterium]
MHSFPAKVTVTLLAVLGVSCALFAASSIGVAPTVGIKGTSPADYRFKPRVLEVGKGATVNWRWDSNAPHNVTFSKLGEHSVTKAAASFKLKFNKAGTYRYVCTVHDFSGKVVVG